jgi:nicotinamide mononucleotide transporter
MTGWEITANALNAVSIVLAARNRVHTWWVGILGCAAFAYVFFVSKLYADVTLQLFFIVTSAIGWWRWSRGEAGRPLPVKRSKPAELAGWSAAAVVAAAAYGLLLWKFTDAAAPFWDSLVLTFSVFAQFLLMARRIENWWAWLIVNTLAVPLFFSRELYLTSALYLAFWFNAWFGLAKWRREL